MFDDNKIIISLFNLILADSTHNNKDLLNLYRICPNIEDFVKIIKLFSGRKVKFPTEDEINESMILSLVYYYKYEKNMTWEEVKSLVPYDFNPVGYAAKISGFNTQLRKKINKLMELSNG